MSGGLPADEVRALLDRADESLLAARELLDHRHPDFAASRAYYAAFYAAMALLQRDGLSYSKHSGVVAAIHQFYVHPGTLADEQGRNLSWLFEIRALGDYGTTERVPDAEAERAISSARAFVGAVRGLVAKLEG